MNGLTLARWINLAMPLFRQASDELGALDAASGDGDLGFTVAAGADTVTAALDYITATATPSDVLRTVGAAFARGNPSSFAALTSAGVLAAARAVEAVDDVGAGDAVRALDAAVATIAERGRSQVGDRTLLDSLAPSVDDVRGIEATSTRHILDRMIAAARDGAARTAEMTPRRGRAAWVGERSAGVPDAGATAYVRLLEALGATLATALAEDGGLDEMEPAS